MTPCLAMSMVPVQRQRRLLGRHFGLPRPWPDQGPDEVHAWEMVNGILDHFLASFGGEAEENDREVRRPR